MSIINEALAKQSAKLAQSAKDGALVLDGVTYSIKFNHAEWVYIVTDQDGDTIARFNTKSLAKAKQWLREWFAN